MEKSIVLKLGGSLLYDADMKINRLFITKFINWINSAKNEYDHVVIIIGGGTISRHLVEQISPYVQDDMSLHRIGMEVTITNAVMLASVISDSDVFVPRTLGEALEALVGDRRKIIVSGGFKAGWSTDMDAAVMADIANCNRVYKLSNIDAIYTEDPKNNPNASPIKDISWREYFKQFGITDGIPVHTPGMHVPIGAFASQFAARKGITFSVAGGANLEMTDNISEVLNTGTLVHP